MIAILYGLCAVALLVTVLIKKLSDTLRGLVCWTISAITSAICMVIYFSVSSAFTAELSAIIPAIMGIGVVAVIAVLIELLSPASRFRTERVKEYDRAAAESSLNIVLLLICCAASAAAAATELLSQVQFSIFGMIPAMAISIRQLTYFMGRVKSDTLNTQAHEQKRRLLLRSLSAGKRGL